MERIQKETFKLKFIDFLRHGYIFLKYVQNQFINHRNVQDTQQYWISPDNGQNNPILYLDGGKKGFKRTEELVKRMEELGLKNPKILEIGCNAGRNLNALHEAGYTNLTAIEISDKAVQVLRQNYPRLKDVEIKIGAAEELLTEFDDNSFDIVYTMAVLQHIHPKSIDRVISNICRVSKSFCLIHECETHAEWKHFPRSYRLGFMKFGFNHIVRLNSTRIFKKIN